MTVSWPKSLTCFLEADENIVCLPTESRKNFSAASNYLLERLIRVTASSGGIQSI